jgi:hypothetical protein
MWRCKGRARTWDAREMERGAADMEFLKVGREIEDRQTSLRVLNAQTFGGEGLRNADAGGELYNLILEDI